MLQNIQWDRKDHPYLILYIAACLIDTQNPRVHALQPVCGVIQKLNPLFPYKTAYRSKSLPQHIYH